MALSTAPVTLRRATSLPVGRDNLLVILEFLLGPFLLVVSLWIVTYAVLHYLSPRYVLLSVVVFALTFPGSSHLNQTPWSALRHVLFGWFAVSALLYLFGYASGYLRYFSYDVLQTWWWVALSTQVGAHFTLRLAAPKIIAFQGGRRFAIVAGVNAQGLELVKRMAADPYSPVQFLGFFDDRDVERIDPHDQYKLLGSITDLPAYARTHQVDLIYLSLPMATQSRILSLLEGLRDTTASIYFVPDIFMTDLIQGRMDTVGGLPVVAVCETPFTGLSGIIKRTSDIVLSMLILALIAPLLLIIALTVKLSSPGPVIFKQRRYGLDGRDIIVYKFRTMNVWEDGDRIVQAYKADPRITPVGRFLRRASLDELPQFINVLQGRMSIVGPRPHAVAHNEMYRKLITGYMLRHKVKPGITGWAQVNGYRGQTETLDQMSGRIEYDLEYLRNWSLRLDLYIIAKTLWVIFLDKGAY